MDQMTFIFGPGVEGLSVESAARQSSRSYVRSEGEISIYDEHRRPTGHQLTAWEAYSTFGLRTLEEAAEYSGAVIKAAPNATGEALRKRREELGLTPTLVAWGSQVSPEEVETAESFPHELPIHKLLRIAFVLGLDERFIAYKENLGHDSPLPSRLRTLDSDYPHLVGNTPDEIVVLLSEAASVICAQHRLEMWLQHPMEVDKFHPVEDYPSDPDEAGHELAMTARDVLQLDRPPIHALRELSEERLGIPVVETLLPEEIAGATLATTDGSGDTVRGIVLNSSPDSQHIWGRWWTLAHAIGHILYDPGDRLRDLRLEPHCTTPWGQQAQTPEDYFEQRANAFATGLLSSPEYESSFQEVSEHGSTPEAAHFVTLSVIEDDIEIAPAMGPVSLEGPTTEEFPFENTSELRRGRFASVVATAYDQDFISAHTGAMYLSCGVAEFKANFADLASRYPEPRSYVRRHPAG